ncbi:MAG: dihydroorotate dehydrogenase-like protein [Bacteroidota bacterium]|jgi:dihydroorotate dehydrogenase (fumarate)|nr:dihydroorotate dehydrogenase-like protein [Bacteroidota bacterium]
MPNLSTSYMGLTLKNPIIVASSGLTRSLEKVKECEAAGAGAVVLKSLFEEVLIERDAGMRESVIDHTEAYDYYFAGLERLYGARDYTDMIKRIKAECAIPVIASINCVSDEWWPEFAAQLQAAGADALELNVFTTATDLSMDAARIEDLYFRILATVKRHVHIPVALKIGPWFSALPHLAVAFGHRELDALVLFNRFTQPDIDIAAMKLKTTFSFSSGDELALPLKWTALMSHYLPYDLCATTGIKSADDVIKLLLAGASAVQVASVLYQQGLGTIARMTAGLEEWMSEKGFDSIAQFRGTLSFHSADTAAHYLRAQFMEKISEIE